MTTKLFKNLIAYSLNGPLLPHCASADVIERQAALQALLAEFEFTPCHSSAAIQSGWAAPLGRDSKMLSHACGDHLLIVYRQEKREVPAPELASRLEQKVAEIEAAENRRMSRKERCALKDDLLAALLPYAFSKFEVTPIWLDLKHHRLCVDAVSYSRAERAISLLRKTLGTLSLTPFPVNALDAGALLTAWVADNDDPALPACYQLGDTARLRGPESGSISLKDCDLRSEEVQSHLAAGMAVNSLALDWVDTGEDGYITVNTRFTLNDDLVLKNIKIAGMEIEEQQSDQEGLDAEFAILSGLLSQLLNQLARDFSAPAESAGETPTLEGE